MRCAHHRRLTLTALLRSLASWTSWQGCTRTGAVRTVNVGGLACPCGGTHVTSTSELGRVVVDGIKVKGKATRVSYHVEDA